VILGSTGVAFGAALIGTTSCGKGRNGKVVLGLIGCGARGVAVASGICQSDKNVQVKYVCDVNDRNSAEAASQLSKLLGTAPSKIRTMETVFEDKEVDAVIIATPEHWQARATILACQAGKDVYVEANPSHSIWEGRKMQECAQRHKKMVQVGFQNRSAAHALNAREYIQSGKLGQIIHVKTYSLNGGSKWMPSENASVPEGLDWNSWIGPSTFKEYNSGIYDINNQGGWRNYWAFGSGILSGEAAHLLDLARMALGDPGHPIAVHCSGGNWCWGSEKEVPENQVITYDYGKYAMTCETGSAMSYMKGPKTEWLRVPARIEIYGTEGLMYLGLAEQGWQVIGTEGKILATGEGFDPEQAHFANFIECVRSRKKPACDAKQGHLSATLVHLGNIAYRTGNKKLEFDSEKELFAGNDQANGLVKTAYREKFELSEQV
jgi:predicted dehydrogenase